MRLPVRLALLIALILGPLTVSAQPGDTCVGANLPSGTTPPVMYTGTPTPAVGDFDIEGGTACAAPVAGGDSAICFTSSDGCFLSGDFSCTVNAAGTPSGDISLHVLTGPCTTSGVTCQSNSADTDGSVSVGSFSLNAAQNYCFVCRTAVSGPHTWNVQSLFGCTTVPVELESFTIDGGVVDLDQLNP